MFLGLDLGTSSVKALLLDREGRELGEGSHPYAVRAPRPGWAESDPSDWLSGALAAARKAIADRGPEVGAIAVCGQMHGVVLVDEGGQPLRPAILWADTRATAEVERFRRLPGPMRRQLGNPAASGMAGPTLLWLRDHEPDVFRRARWALQPKDWLRARLGGGLVSDHTDASATLLYDLEQSSWHARVLERLGLQPDLLPRLWESWSVTGTLGRDLAGEMGIDSGIPIAAGAADTAAALLGSGLVDPGAVQVTVGTGGQIVAPLDRPRPDPAERTHCFRAVAPDRWYRMAAILNAGLALEWVLRVLDCSWDEVYRQAFQVAPGADGVTFLPYLNGERTPLFDPSASGAWIGLHAGHGRGHLLRAALEGVGFALRQALEALESTGLAAPSLRLAGGGTLDPRWRRLLADILGRPLLPLAVAAASARGAALLAAVAGGALSSVRESLALAPHTGRAIEPQADRGALESAYRRYTVLAGEAAMLSGDHEGGRAQRGAAGRAPGGAHP